MYKKIILIFLILSTVIFIFINPILCYANDNNKKILIIGSYSPKNKWEVSITKGFWDAGKDRYTVKAEFLDSESFEEEGYEESFINFYLIVCYCHKISLDLHSESYNISIIIKY